jgi:hypothetical protein
MPVAILQYACCDIAMPVATPNSQLYLYQGIIAIYLYWAYMFI